MARVSLSNPRASQRQVVRTLVLGTAVLLGACGKRTVPFKRDSTSSGPATLDSGTPAVVAPPPVGRAYPPRTQQIQVGPHKLTITEGALRASLELPAATPEGPSALLLLVEGADGSLALERRQGSGEAPSERIAMLVDAQAGEHCSLEAARLSLLSLASVAATADLQCAASNTPPAPGASQPAAAARAEQRVWAAALEAPARVIASLSVQAAPSSGLTLVPALEHRDLDSDGRLDLLVHLAATLGSEPPLPIELKLFERAGGLTREGGEPENSIRQLAQRALVAHEKREPRAEALARGALLLHRSLCREPGTPRLLLAGRGLDCGASLGAGRAGSVLTAELARQGKLVEALEAARALQQSFYQLAPADSARAQQALRARAETSALQWRDAIRVELARAPAARHSALGFIDETHVLIRGPTARSYDIEAGRADPVGIDAGLTLVDPTGRYAVTSVKRSCEGYHLAIVRAPQVVAGIVTGQSVSEPLFARAAAPAGARCPELSADQRRDHGGYRVIEWTAAGIVLARAQELLLLELDAGASGAEPARPIGAGERLPAVTYSGEFTPDGRYHVWLSAEGIALRDRTRDVTRFLAAPTGAGAMTDVAISPSGRMLAILRGGQLFIGALDAPPTPPTH